MSLNSPTTCKECGSKNLKWFADVKNYGGVQDGLLKLNEVRPIFYLGCDDCSATLQILEGNIIADLLNTL